MSHKHLQSLTLSNAYTHTHTCAAASAEAAAAHHITPTLSPIPAATTRDIRSWNSLSDCARMRTHAWFVRTCMHTHSHAPTESERERSSEPKHISQQQQHFVVHASMNTDTYTHTHTLTLAKYAQTIAICAQTHTRTERPFVPPPRPIQPAASGRQSARRKCAPRVGCQMWATQLTWTSIWYTQRCACVCVQKDGRQSCPHITRLLCGWIHLGRRLLTIIVYIINITHVNRNLYHLYHVHFRCYYRESIQKNYLNSTWINPVTPYATLTCRSYAGVDARLMAVGFFPTATVDSPNTWCESTHIFNSDNS